MKQETDRESDQRDGRARSAQTQAAVQKSGNLGKAERAKKERAIARRVGSEVRVDCKRAKTVASSHAPGPGSVCVVRSATSASLRLYSAASASRDHFSV